MCSRNVTSSSSTSGIRSVPIFPFYQQRVSYKNQELRKHHRHPSSSLFLRGVVPISWPENVTFRLDDDDCFVLCLVFGGVFVAQLLSFLILFSFSAIVQ